MRANDRSRRRRYAAALATVGLVATVVSVVATNASAASAGYAASLVQTPAAGSALAVNSATDTIYLATNSGLIVVNGATNTVTTTISTATPVAAIAVNSATNTVYVAASPGAPGPVIDVISGATNTITASISVPIDITSLAVDPTTNTVYAAEAALSQVTVIAGATNTITTNVATGAGTRPYRLAVDQSSDTVWAADPSGGLIGIHGATNTLASDISLPGTQPVSVAVNEGSNTIYVGDPRNDQVIVLDGKTGAVITDIAVGPALYGLDVDQSSGVVYASASLAPEGTTWVINGSTNEIENSIGRGSVDVAVDQATGVVYEPDVRQAAIFILATGAANAMSPVITSAGSGGLIVGDAAISISVTSSALPAANISETGPLPSGVTMSASGVLSGNPAAGTGGVYPITITASNGVAPNYTQQFSLTVYEGPAITSGDSATFQVGTAGSFALTATGYTPPSFTYSGTLPAGLSITDQTPGGWQIAGTPAAGTGGVYPITILAYNGVSSEAQQTFTLTVKEAPSFISSAKATFVAWTAGSYQVSANGYPAPTYSETGVLPGGLTLSSAGLLAGKPAAGSGGVYPITITASNGISPSASQAFALTVDQAPAITSARSATFRAGRLRRFIFRTTGFPVAKLTERGHLPAGVRFRARDNGTALLAGRAIRADRGKTFVITVIARNGVGATVRETFRLKVA